MEALFPPSKTPSSSFSSPEWILKTFFFSSNSIHPIVIVSRSTKLMIMLSTAALKITEMFLLESSTKNLVYVLWLDNRTHKWRVISLTNVVIQYLELSLLNLSWRLELAKAIERYFPFKFSGKLEDIGSRSRPKVRVHTRTMHEVITTKATATGSRSYKQKYKINFTKTLTNRKKIQSQILNPNLIKIM